jgi:hypothetical protein
VTSRDFKVAMIPAVIDGIAGAVTVSTSLQPHTALLVAFFNPVGTSSIGSAQKGDL